MWRIIHKVINLYIIDRSPEVFFLSKDYFFQQDVVAWGCLESTETATPVSICPKTEKEWQRAANRKNCSNMKHTCSSFVYHCVINAWINETIEVCAPKRVVIGEFFFCNNASLTTRVIGKLSKYLMFKKRRWLLHVYVAM